ncbi:MAG: penicillin-binding protein 2, partial [Candidatus Omnitrophica bacterium]|nr:penicillin-binding protein 2 [Candidatus Omnitrophota bacterium]
YFYYLSKNNSIRIIPQEGARGRILDRNSNVLVDNYLSFDILALAGDMQDKDKTFKRLSEILEVPEETLRRRFSLRYFAAFSPVKIAENIERSRAIKIEMFNQELSGITLQAAPKRHYPYGKLASQVIGYLGEIDYWRLEKLKDYGYQAGDIVGYGGVEERYDYYLRSVKGGLQVEVDHRGRFKRTLGYRYPANGKDVQLTLDINLQKIAEDCLSDNKGAVVIMEPSSGEILAMVSFPGFNPDVFLQGSPAQVQKIFGDPDAPLLNRSIGSVFQPGSVFKAVTAVAGLSTGKIEPATTYFCPGSMRVGKRIFSCWNTHGVQNLYQAIAHSCDVYFYHVGLAVGPQAMSEFAAKLGLGKPTGIDLPQEASGNIPSPLARKSQRRGWYEGDTANFAIGQGEVQVTPLQLARMMAVFANGGFLVTPYIIKSIDGKDASRIRRRIEPVGVNKNFIDIVRKGLRQVVEDEHGTADILNLAKVPIAGKTGTAEAPPKQPHSWFVGFFPYDSPKFTLCVFLEHGGSSHYAVAIARKIIERMLEENLL